MKYLALVYHPCVMDIRQCGPPCHTTPRFDNLCLSLAEWKTHYPDVIDMEFQSRVRGIGIRAAEHV